MKKIIAFASCYLLFQCSILCQTSIFVPHQVGFNLGFYSSTIAFEHNYGSGLNDYLLTPAYSFGINAAWSIHKNDAFGLELNYSIQGQNHEDWKVENDPDFYFQRSIDLRYFRMPMYYRRVYSINNALLKFSIEAGGYFGILHQAKLTYRRRGETLSFYDAVTEKNDFANEIIAPDSHNELFQPLDAGLLLGWGVQYRSHEHTKLVANLRWEIGAVDINDKDWRYPHPTFGYRPSVNSLFGLKIGVIQMIK